MHSCRVLVLMSLTWITGCPASAYTFTKTGSTPTESKPSNCDLTVGATKPAGDFEEVGVFDVNPRGASAPSDLPTFRTMVTPDACTVGADVVIAVPNGLGTYVKGIAYRRVSAAAKPDGGG